MSVSELQFYNSKSLHFIYYLIFLQMKMKTDKAQQESKIDMYIIRCYSYLQLPKFHQQTRMHEHAHTTYRRTLESPYKTIIYFSPAGSFSTLPSFPSCLPPTHWLHTHPHMHHKASLSGHKNSEIASNSNNGGFT